MTIDELLASGETRRRALEALLVAHVLINPQLLERRTAPRLTPAARAVLDIVRANHTSARINGPLTVALRLLRLTRGHWPRGVHAWDVARIAQRAERLTLDELVYLPTETILRLLDSHPRTASRKTKADRILEAMEATAA